MSFPSGDQTAAPTVAGIASSFVACAGFVTVTVAQGTNRLVGLNPEKIIAEGMAALTSTQPRGTIPELWDGRASRRILDVLTRKSTASKPRLEATAEMFFS